MNHVFDFPFLVLPALGGAFLLIAGVLYLSRLRAERKAESDRDQATARRIEAANMEAAGIKVSRLVDADGTHVGAMVFMTAPAGGGGSGAVPVEKIAAKPHEGRLVTLDAGESPGGIKRALVTKVGSTKKAQAGKAAPKTKKKFGGKNAKAGKAKA